MNIRDTMAGRDLQALRAGIAGQVFAPGQAGYDQARQAWNLAVDTQPAVVVTAKSAADVAQAVRHARAHGIRIAPQGKGHGAEPPCRPTWPWPKRCGRSPNGTASRPPRWPSPGHWPSPG
jgi:hypothetical protein